MSKLVRLLLTVVILLIAVFVVPKLRDSESSNTGSASTPSRTTSNGDTSRTSNDSRSIDEPNSRNAPKSADSSATKTTSDSKTNTSPKSKPKSTSSNIGFTTKQHWQEHFEKHGAEFGDVTKDEYLALAQALRDAPVGGNILEAVREDGTVSRFDKKSGAFLAFNRDKTIRTFFKPNDGVRYFERQIDKAH